MEKRLYRDESRKVIGGVCAGLSDYFGIDIAIVRLVFLLTLILKGGGMLIYIILWIALPKKGAQANPSNFNNPNVDYTVPNAGAQPQSPQFFNQPARRLTGSIIAGTVLVLLGAFFILDDLNIIPDWDMEHLWPVILIAVGVIVIFSGRGKQPWEQEGWNKTHNTTDSSTHNNPPTL